MANSRLSSGLRKRGAFNLPARVNDDEALRRQFAPTLLEWSATLDRPMPWRGERDAYRIWLSEVILQQTRVAQGEAYYRRFLEAYPTVSDLAAAPADDVMALWQGLGYYSRARNLHRAAQEVVRDHDGIFPTDYAALLTLPGVGPYSAAAVASFASNEDVAVVDGNVYRVLARIFGVSEPIDTPAGQRVFRGLADELLPRGRAGAYNQAIMDFGATVCTPRRPRCPECPFRENCIALATDRIADLPLKSKRLARRRRHLDYLHLEGPAGRVLLRRRGAGDIWQGLFDLPVAESTKPRGGRPAASAAQLLEQVLPGLTPYTRFVSVTPPAKTLLTHQELILRFWRFAVSGEGVAVGFPERERGPRGDGEELPPLTDPSDVLRWVASTDLVGLGVPQPLRRYLDDPQTSLTL